MSQNVVTCTNADILLTGCLETNSREIWIKTHFVLRKSINKCWNKSAILFRILCVVAFKNGFHFRYFIATKMHNTNGTIELLLGHMSQLVKSNNTTNSNLNCFHFIEKSRIQWNNISDLFVAKAIYYIIYIPWDGIHSYFDIMIDFQMCSLKIYQIMLGFHVLSQSSL